MNQWMQENALVDVKVNYEWKIARIKRISNDFVEVALDESENYKKKIDLGLVARVRSLSGLEAVKNFAAQFNLVQLEYVEKVVFQYDFESFSKNEDFFLQFFRASLPIFVYSLVKSEITEVLNVKDRVFKVFFKVLDLVVKFLQSFSKILLRKSFLKGEVPGRGLFETWPEILDICEVLLGKEEFIRNFYEVCQYIPDNFHLENGKTSISVFQAVFVEHFIQNQGLEALLQLIDSLPQVFSPQVVLIFGVDFGFYQQILPENLKTAFFSRISTKFLSICENCEENLVKAEDYSKIFRNFVTLIEESQDLRKEIEFSYFQALVRAFFSNSLEKRIKGISELNCFIERKSRIMSDLELVELINDQSILSDVLQKRAHFQILKRAAPFIRFLAKQGKLDENEMNMILHLENSQEKETHEAFYIILKAIQPFLNVDSQKMFGVLITFYRKDQGSLVFDKDLFYECLSSSKDYVQIAKTLKNISEIIMLPENISLKESFFQLYPILQNELTSSYFYLRLLLFTLPSLPENELNETHKKLSLYQSTVENLLNYLKYYQNFCKGSDLVLRVPHKEQVLARFEILEFMMEKSQFLISRNTQKKLFAMCLYQNDNTLKKIYQKSIVSGNTYSSILTSEEHIIKLFSDENFSSTYSIFSFKVLKHIFFKVNENSSLLLENSTKKNKKKFICVLNKDIIAKEVLFKLFYISKKNELGKIKVLIRNLLSCYSFEIIENSFSIFKENLDMLKSFHDPENNEDVYKFIGILRDIFYGVTESSSGAKVSIILVFPTGKERFEVGENTNVFYIRKYFCSRLKNDLSEVSFCIEKKVYSCNDNSTMLRLSNDMEIFYVQQQMIFEITNSDALTETLKDYQDFCWKLVVANGKFSRFALDIVKKLGCSEIVQMKAAHFEVTQEDFQLEKLFLSVQIVYQVYLNFCNEKTHENAKISQGLKNVLKGISAIIHLPEVENEFTGYILVIIHYSLYFKNFDCEAVLKIYINTLNWLIKNLNSSKFSEIFEQFAKIWHSMAENIEENIINDSIRFYMIENFREIMEKCSEYERESNETTRFAEYLRYFISISLLDETFLQELNTTYFESIKIGKSSYLEIIFKSILKYLKNHPKKLKNYLESHFKPLLPLLSESPLKENKNLKLSLEILSDHPESLQDFSFESFLKEYLFTLPDPSKSILPRCKSNSTRIQAFKFIVEFIKAHPSHTQSLLKNLNFFTHLKFFRRIDQKFWRISITSPKSPYKNLIGLRNPSSICYSNSLIQQLFHIPYFREYILEVLPSGQCPLVDSLRFLFTKLQFSLSSAVSGKSLVRVMNNSSNYSDQKDADEYLSNLFTGLLNSKLDQAALAINLFFSFSQLFEVVPVDCGHKQVIEEVLNCFSIDLTTDSLLNGLRKAFQGELLQHENAYACEKCKRKVTAVRRQSFRTLPNFLIFVLKRFSFDAGSGCRVKVNDRFLFDEKIVMKEFLNNEFADLNQSSQFYLKGITLHTGNTDQGHYFSYIRTDDERWVEFNDGEINEIKKDLAFSRAFGGKNDENSPSAYILIYEKTKTDFGTVKLTGNLQKHLKSKEISKVLQKNEEIKQKEIIFSDNFLEFMEALLGIPGTDIVCCEFFFACFIRMSLTDSYTFKFFKKFYETSSQASVEHLLKMISSNHGCLELIFFNNRQESKALIVLLIKKYINSFSLDFLYFSASALLSAVNTLHSAKTDAPDLFYEILSLILPLLEDFCKQEKITGFYIETLIKRYPKFSQLADSIDLEIICKENYSNIPQSLKPLNASLSYLFLYLSENMYRLTETEKETLASEQYLNFFIQQANQKLEIIYLSQMYANLYENDANSAFNYMIHLLQLSFDRNYKYFKLMSLFISRYNKRLQILNLFLESYVELLSAEMDHRSAYMIKYLVKFLRKVKKSDLTDSSPELLKKISTLVECYYAFCGSTYDSNKIMKIFQGFEKDEDLDIQDSDDEIDEKFLKKDLTVYLPSARSSSTSRAIILDSLENEILLVKYEENNAVKMIDKSRFETIQISFHN